MKLQFKHQGFQLDAVESIASLFQGQPKEQGQRYQLDPGRGKADETDLMMDGFGNTPIRLDEQLVREQVRTQQIAQGLEPSQKLHTDMVNGRLAYHFSIEMETGTGKTYTYIRTIMELNKRYGWLKFIVVVPSVAIREGVLKSFEMMQDHFQMEYGKKPRYFVYDSSRLGDLDTFANTSDIQVMIINSQAFNAKGKDARRIHMEQESFRWRRPIDVIASMRPILIIDEPQSVEGKATKERLKDFKPLFTLRYSATHKEKYDMVYRLDAMDAYNKKLVKKIAVKTIESSGTTGTNGYLYLQDLLPQKSGAPKAKIEFEARTQSGVTRKTKTVEEGFDLYAESGELAVYKGWTLSHFDARDNRIQIGVDKPLHKGEIIGEQNEDDLRILQIRETIKTHLKKEAVLYRKGIKVLSLFFIDEVAKYKQYDEQHNPLNGSYARVFETEYKTQVADYLKEHPEGPYSDYLREAGSASQVHAGYFSVDKVKKSTKTIFIDSKGKGEEGISEDKDAYDLIMKDKERLLSFEEPVRFLFSHSALREGWDNPNVFQICTLRHTGSETAKRQSIGRGMRLAVDQAGVRQDVDLLGADVHQINLLTVIANESFDSFSRSLQEEIRKELADRPDKVDTALFIKYTVLKNAAGASLEMTEEVAHKIMDYLIREDYLDRDGKLTEACYQAREANAFVWPEEVADFGDQLLAILDSVHDGSSYPVENGNQTSIVLGDEINQENLNKAEFLALWNKINHKTVYQVAFDDEELIEKAVKSLNHHLHVKEISYQIREESLDKIDKEGLSFTVAENSIQTQYRKPTDIETTYDLLGEVTEKTQLTRRTVAQILQAISPKKFDLFQKNPEEFIQNVSKLINQEKATQIIEHIEYHMIDEVYETDVFTENRLSAKIGDDYLLESRKGIYNYTKVDSKIEKEFQKDLERHEEVSVYTKLPSGFFISTPLGKYNPDWAVTFKEGSVKHIYFVAETKGSMSSLDLKQAEQSKIACARAHFKSLRKAGILEDDTVYDVVDSYEGLLSIVRE
ncbi:type III restriction-modification system endonuclease [Streptococcus marmotae]|uniref:type III restriction-modification system endonuclease n=1 Tax=Streptococcus marmotae TaxID=1825069 RepID=UPI000832DDAF|nr:DEAD/DEAH box helicase family protein [Streptococcus marmotae]